MKKMKNKHQQKLIEQLEREDKEYSSDSNDEEMRDGNNIESTDDEEIPKESVLDGNQSRKHVCVLKFIYLIVSI